ncbi:MAG TPA: hypothetical protein VF316_00420 [Polyangiaceae bacterium]
MSKRMQTSVVVGFVTSVLALACGTSASTADAAPPCDQACQDGIALRSLREGMRLLYNFALQGKPVGPQDAKVPCPLGGSAHVFGTATSNAVQGATDVQLTYALDHCAYSGTNTDPLRNYSVTFNGTVVETGTLAVQPTSTTALELSSDALDVTGTVHVPTVDYTATACKLAVSQNGNTLSGQLCGRTAGVTL